ncbi:hypothetical protein F4V43_02370 [Paenibacillus spiritus]|uniref:Uncharacterized protein n=1 Tax=Paenibacillus spiritus TaxID=2496557 RepID=A0A5J5GGR6_9BACL|nr:hypothetical protein [Paenibacillus spiritus]KAA9007351.1 hypothetical protein F4V43_02370 [Paenibacillus spiritus]
MNKITEISAMVDSEEFIKLFSMFSSTFASLRDITPEYILSAVNGDCQPLFDEYMQILKWAEEPYADIPASVHFERREVDIITPTSGRKLEIIKLQAGGLLVRWSDSNGSSTAFGEILGAFEKRSIEPEVTTIDAAVDVLLTNKTVEELDELGGYYYYNDRVIKVSDAKAKVLMDKKGFKYAYYVDSAYGNLTFVTL